MTYAAILILLAVAGLAIWIRTAPSDPTLWNVVLSLDAVPGTGTCAQQITTLPNGATSSCLMTEPGPAVLARLTAIALASPRTVLLAGSPAEGRMTWVSRSQVMGFPDYITAQTTAQPQGTRLDVFSRQRFGSRDMGVNTARLKAWLGAL